jgi:hypothetical protein
MYASFLDWLRSGPSPTRSRRRVFRPRQKQRFQLDLELLEHRWLPSISLLNINPATDSANPASLTDVNGTLLFSADDGLHGRQLWESNGSTAPPALRFR